MPLPVEEKKIWDMFMQAKEQLAEARDRCKQAERELSARSDNRQVMIDNYNKAKAEFDKVYANDDPMSTPSDTGSPFERSKRHMLDRQE